MSQTLRSDLGALGAVDHFSNSKQQISYGHVGRRYRVVRSHVVNGTLHETPVDDRLFDSVYDVRAAARALRIAESAA